MPSNLDREGQSRDPATLNPGEIASDIRDFAESVDDPDNWRVLVPVEVFDEVEDLLDTEKDIHLYYRGITLCYTSHHRQTRVEYTNGLSDHLEGEK